MEGKTVNKQDPGDRPAYHLTEAARYLRLPPATLRSWTVGRPYPTRGGSGHSRAIIRPASAKPPVLSFWNLIEAHVLRALRTDHGLTLSAARKAVDYAEKQFGIDRLLLSPELKSGAGHLFLERYGELVNLSLSGQLDMRKVLEAHLARVDYKAGFPVRLRPFVFADMVPAESLITIDPTIAFGRPILSSRGVSTETIAARIDAGEGAASVAADYGVSKAEFEQAVVYERAA